MKKYWKNISHLIIEKDIITPQEDLVKWKIKWIKYYKLNISIKE